MQRVSFIFNYSVMSYYAKYLLPKSVNLNERDFFVRMFYKDSYRLQLSFIRFTLFYFMLFIIFICFTILLLNWLYQMRMSSGY